MHSRTPYLAVAVAALALAAAPVSGVAQQTGPGPDRFVGTWGGTLQAGATLLRLSLTVARDSAGGLTGHLVSLDQGDARVAGSVSVAGDTLRVSMPAIGAEYAGALRGDTLTGIFRQGAGALPLQMARAGASGAGSAGASTGRAFARPQEPKPPFPYRTREVTFESVPGVRLAGTLTLPNGPGPFPAAVLISGSGAQDRDEALFGHKPFHVLADHLARRGIATLRYDDRGVAKSTGDFAGSTSADFANDAEAAVRFLRGAPDIARDRVGVIGHSEGGIIGPAVAARSRDVAFVVMLAGPGVPGDSLLILQSRALLGAAGAAPEGIERAAAANRRIYTAVIVGTDSADIERRIREAEAEFVAKLPAAEQAAADSALVQGRAGMMAPWVRHFLAYDPRPALQQVAAPVLALNGTLDLQVPHRENLAGIAEALAAGGNRDYEVDSLPGLNHLFQTARTGAVSEYATIQETMSPLALERISGWIAKRFVRR
jgi:hypothetical protein